MGINPFDRRRKNALAFGVQGKLTPDQMQGFLPDMKTAIANAGRSIRVLIDVTQMQDAHIKSEWEVFEYLNEHIDDIELVTIIGSHPWDNMSEVLSESVFKKTETCYFNLDEIDHAWDWVLNANHPKDMPMRKVINTDKE